MTNSDAGLERLFRDYRAACPEIEPGADFMPSLWRKIEARQSFWSVFGRSGKLVSSASAAVCLVLLFLNLFSSPAAYTLAPTYADALMADHSAERTDYAEAIRSTPADAPVDVPAR